MFNKANNKNEKKTINFKEFVAICIAMYKLVLPKMLITALALLASALLIDWLL
ncbi:hypothetical protein IMX26_11185 [Clostridium sp. 'deep sea']|uniref:hypothetical protein n=1 Tax=Clostridium sp. 'deep sea' TaxID=2779445 RepID=UPI00189653C6|nr:hypothetical protein [Clostridium sp. 'deep sea']QOR34054.1 hypothetical protein IMX26_11185 [Clostridium sp. 'deep sea']